MKCPPVSAVQRRALFFAVCFEWFSSLLAMTTYQPHCRETKERGEVEKGSATRTIGRRNEINSPSFLIHAHLNWCCAAESEVVIVCTGAGAVECREEMQRLVEFVWPFKIIHHTASTMIQSSHEKGWWEAAYWLSPLFRPGKQIRYKTWLYMATNTN